MLISGIVSLILLFMAFYFNKSAAYKIILGSLSFFFFDQYVESFFVDDEIKSYGCIVNVVTNNRSSRSLIIGNEGDLNRYIINENSIFSYPWYERNIGNCFEFYYYVNILGSRNFLRFKY
ncbi:hypothetical protein SAMN03080615_01260 [Amphritea atlantica]|uniref:Uncharacterized protein n=1 Tax=Amphritea atlantica TaxID=355243 RepID=A0A1H9FID4_9GAMM|nr:hypothetical protein SAMN03080615_01260 [Amphritea atlantica]